MKIRRGDIALLAFPFTDLRGVKLRPALVVSDDKFNKTGESVFVFITTKFYNTAFDFTINREAVSFKSTGLKESSTFRVSKIMCLEQRLIKRRLGVADKSILNNVSKRLKSLFCLSR